MSGRWPPPPLPNTAAASRLRTACLLRVARSDSGYLCFDLQMHPVQGVGGAGEGRFMSEQDGRAADGFAPAQLLLHAPATAQAAAQLLVCA